MDEQTSNLLKSTMTYGLNLGLVSVIFSVILYIFNIMPVGFVMPLLLLVISLAITFFLIIYFTKKIRAELYDGSVTFREALLIGVLIAFFASIITSFYGLIQNLVIDPDYMARYVEAQKIWMYDFMSSRGIPESTIMDSMDKIDERVSDYKPVREFFKSIFMGTLFGFIVSLITAAILRKKTQVFE